MDYWIDNLRQWRQHILVGCFLSRCHLEILHGEAANWKVENIEHEFAFDLSLDRKTHHFAPHRYLLSHPLPHHRDQSSRLPLLAPCLRPDLLHPQ